MTTSTFREISEGERQLLDRLLVDPFPGQPELKRQLASARVRTIDDHGCLEFSVRGVPKAEVIHRVPVEGEYDDADGVTAHVLLHVVDGNVRELEIFKEDGSEICQAPTVDSLRITHAAG